MRALLPLALLLAAAGPAAADDAGTDAWACIPEALLCGPGQALCPMLGGTFGWCVRPEAGDDGVAVEAAAGNWPAPRAGAAAAAAWAAPGSGEPFAEASAGAWAELCREASLAPLLGWSAGLAGPDCAQAQGAEVRVGP